MGTLTCSLDYKMFASAIPYNLYLLLQASQFLHRETVYLGDLGLALLGIFRHFVSFCLSGSLTISDTENLQYAV